MPRPQSPARSDGSGPGGQELQVSGSQLAGGDQQQRELDQAGHRQRRRIQGRCVRPVHRLPSELLHIRTRAKSPGQNGVRERAFGSLKYEHLYRHAEQIATLADLYREAEAYRMIFNHARPHEALGIHRPIEIIREPSLHPIHKNQTEESAPRT
jgi:putative transposase